MLMNRLYSFFIVLPLLIISNVSIAQTASSLFWRSDSLQVKEIVSETGDQYRKIGHHGPAVENSHMALRIYFNDSGAIDVYSKSGRGMELIPLRCRKKPVQAVTAILSVRLSASEVLHCGMGRKRSS